MAAVTQIRFYHSPGRGYYDGKIAEGKTPKESMRALKRRISDALWGAMVADARRAAATTAAAAKAGPGGQPGNDSVTSAAGSHPETPALRPKPLPNPDQGYDHQASPASRVEDAGQDGPKKRLTTKEDSIDLARELTLARECRKRVSWPASFRRAAVETT
ncbi:MAG: hypothetical protein M3P83_00615 [Actinomycetota bacterium]|nr:hypothetical protein [Actinomycetota bacterium]